MKKNLQVLSRSVLLEESGLPRINRNIILAVFCIVSLFVIWASRMTINDMISIEGEVVQNSTEYGFFIKASVFSSDVGSISEKMDAYISIAGVTDKKKMKATITEIIKVPQIDKYGRTYYEVRVMPDTTLQETAYYKKMMIRGMDARVEVVTGTRNLLQYYFSKVWDARTNE